MFQNFFLITGLLGLLSCSDAVKSTASLADTNGLADQYVDYFPVGVALAPQSLFTKDTVLIQQEFNSITAENVMKMQPIHPEENRYSWGESDQLIDFAIRNNIKIRGHALCWHEQSPDWLYVDEQGEEVSKEVLLARLKTHIETVVGRYRGKIYAWDVVNEAISDDSSRLLRNSRFHQICGEDFIIKAFEYAHAADPEAKLFYNDYNADWPEKSGRIRTMLKGMLDRGVPIHGMGMQAHWSLDNPTRDNLKSAIEQYASLGLDVQITELDVSVYPWEKKRRSKRSDESDELTAELMKQQTDQYDMFFDVFRRYKDNISGVTFWGLTDANSWLNNHPVTGRKNYPLLFDREGDRKEAYHKITHF